MNEHSAFFGVLLDNAIVISNTIQRYDFLLNPIVFFVGFFWRFLKSYMNCNSNYP